MSGSLIIALDAMGGDQAPRIVLRGANIASRRYPDVRFQLFGDEKRLRPMLRRLRRLRPKVTVHHTDSAVGSDAKPSVALRQGRNSSMQLAINAVRDGNAAGAVSAGNTGALMAMAKMALKTLPGIDRPAIAGYFPTQRGESVMLDLGANIECDARNLVQFSIMGEVFARVVLGLVAPTVGLLNVGTEEPKGHDGLRETAAILRGDELALKFHGFVEGDDITAGTVDVVVTDGFTGNVALKTAEGAARLFAEFLRQTFQSSLASRIGYVFAARAMNKLRSRLDPRRYNGAVLVGVNGIVVKSHGGTDAVGFANAIGVAVDMAANGFNGLITQELARAGSLALAPARAMLS